MKSELLELFTERLCADLTLIGEQVALLQTQQSEATAKLFRVFHNYKASSSYLELTEFHALASAGENILNALRTTPDCVSEHDLKWLQSSLAQMLTWCQQLYANMPLSPADTRLFSKISILNDYTKTSEVMQGLSLLYVDNNAARALAIKAPLSHVFKKVETASSLDALKASLLGGTVDIVILNLQKESVEVAMQLLALKPDIALITAVPQLRVHQKSRLLLKGLVHLIPSPITSSDLKRQLHNLVTSHFSKVHTLISHQKIYSFIQGLDPLPSSVKKISRLCEDPESSIKEIISTIESDAITTANILHAAASPIYGLETTSSLEKAVAAFGKRLVKVLVLSDLAYSLGSLHLEAYNINEEQFKQASALRLALMNSWYSRVNAAELSILGSSAILGNLGQILINKELLGADLLGAFKSSSATEGYSAAEVKLLRTSTAFVSADILEFWTLERELIDAIRYSDSPFNAPNERISALASANAVVYQMVTPRGEFLERIPEGVVYVMKRAGLELSLLEEALTLLKKRVQG
ncbi:MAG: HDOD domain-containing protein [Campylobacterales bacterium]|nr:HDOD domain-containing protein [Campylobacterales bacterium]